MEKTKDQIKKNNLNIRNQLKPIAFFKECQTDRILAYMAYVAVDGAGGRRVDKNKCDHGNPGNLGNLGITNVT